MAKIMNEMFYNKLEPHDGKVTTSIVCVALYDYTAQNNRHLDFRKGEQFEVLDNTSYSDWWLAKSLSTDLELEGYIPSNYVTPGFDT